MSTTTQEKFTAKLQRLADERQLDLVIESSYTNIGHFCFQRQEGFDPLLRFPFNFQPEYSSFSATTKDPGALGYREPGSSRRFGGLKGAELDLAVVRVAELLDRAGALPVEVEAPFIRIVFGRDDVLQWAEGGTVDEATALARAGEWARQIEDAATNLCSEQLRSAVLTGQP